MKKNTPYNNSVLSIKSRLRKPRSTFISLSLVDQITQYLREEILTGNFKGGEQLLEERLKDKFGISRTPLRESFRVLEKEGLIEIIPRKGAYVKRITKQDIEEIFPVRAILEGMAARLAHKNLTKQDINEMEELFGSMKEAARVQDFIGYAKYHFSFHEIFINTCKNKTLISLLRTLRMHTLWPRYTYRYYKTDFRNSLKIHRRIINLFKDKNLSSEDLEEAVRKHIESAVEPFVSFMEALEEKTSK